MPAAGGAGSSEEAGGGCEDFFWRRGRRLCGLSAGAPGAAVGAGGATATSGGEAEVGAAVAGGSGCALNVKLECLLPRATQTIVPPSPSSVRNDGEASPEARAKQRWRKAPFVKGVAGLEDAGGEGSEGFSSGAGGEGSRAEGAKCLPSRDEMGRRGGCCCCYAAGRLGAWLAEDVEEVPRAEESREESAEDAAAAEETNCSGGKVLRGVRGEVEDR